MDKEHRPLFPFSNVQSQMDGHDFCTLLSFIFLSSFCNTDSSASTAFPQCDKTHEQTGDIASHFL